MGQPNLGLTNKICNGEHYPLGDLFGDSLDYVFEDMMNNTPKQGYNYYSMSPYSNNAIAYGHATCNGAISYDDCVLCLGSIKVYISSGCYRSIGAQVSFVDCSMSVIILLITPYLDKFASGDRPLGRRTLHSFSSCQ
nr:antifungal protein ginkbilobin-2-like [Ipomoea batatas]